MDFLKKMVDLEEDRPQEEGEDFEALGREALVAKCTSLSREAKGNREEYDSLFAETATLRKEYDEYRTRHIQAKKKEDAEPKDEERFRQERLELESRISTLKETSAAAENSAAILEQRIEQAEKERTELEATKDEELARLQTKLDGFKDKASNEREGLRREVVELRRRVQEAEDEVEAERARAKEVRRQAEPAAEGAGGPEEDGGEARAELLAQNRDLEAEVASLRQSKKSLQALLDDAQADAARQQAAHATELEEAAWESTEMQQRLKEARAKLSNLETHTATLETKHARLQADLEGKEREAKDLLRKQEDSYKTQIRVLQDTGSSLRDELEETHKRLSEIGSSQALQAHDIGSRHAQLQEQLVSTQDNLKAQMILAEKTSTELKLRTERLSAVEEELKEARGELQRREGTLAELRATADDYSQRLSAMDDQSIETLRTLQAREEDMESIERQRQTFRQQVATSATTITRLEEKVASLEGNLADATAEHEKQQREAEGLGYDMQGLRRQIEALEEQKHAAEVLQAKRDEEAHDLRRRLVDRDSKLDEVLRMKDDLSAKARGLELQLRDKEYSVSGGMRSASPIGAALRSGTASQRSRSVAGRQTVSPPPQPKGGLAGQGGPTGFLGLGCSRNTTLILGFVALIWVVGMYNSFMANTGNSSSHTLELEKLSVHLRSSLDATERALATCRAKMPSNS